MALDTVSKRAFASGLSTPWPSGTIDAPARAHISGVYPFEFEPPAADANALGSAAVTARTTSTATAAAGRTSTSTVTARRSSTSTVSDG